MATDFKPCSVDGCNGNSSRFNGGTKGFCSKHYQRLRVHGDPLIVKKLVPLERRFTPKGAPKEYVLSVVMPYEGNDCILWPFSRDKAGYGKMTRGGKNGIASRFVCEDAYGPPPTPEHEAAHSCGNGNLGCVTKRHLSWKTPIDNTADKLLHGTHNRGERGPAAKLTETQAREILLAKGAERPADTAKRYSVSPRTVYNIQSGVRWKHISP